MCPSITWLQVRFHAVLSQAEKNARASLKAAVERELNKESVLIADDLNYIKGYRYELFCIARAMGMRQSIDASKNS